jgi:hypothetical protein
MKIDKSKNMILFEFKNGLIIELWQALTEIFQSKRFNWNVWQFIMIEFENDMMLGGYEFTFVFLGCGMRIRVPHETKISKAQWKKINSQTKILDDSCYGWTSESWYQDFKNKKITNLMIYRTRQNEFRKKIFIQ